MSNNCIITWELAAMRHLECSLSFQVHEADPGISLIFKSFNPLILMFLSHFIASPARFFISF